MAMSGRIEGGYVASNLRLYLDWSITNWSEDTGIGTLNYKLFIDGSNTVWYLGYSTNNVKIGSSTIYSKTDFGNGSQSNKYILYGRQADNGKSTTIKANETWYGLAVGKWYVVMSTLASGSMEIQFDEEGYFSTSVSGTVTSSGGSASISGTITPDRIDRFKKSRHTSNGGSSWSQDRYFWKTNDYGVTWRKCNAYVTYNGTSSRPTWNKID